MQHIKLTINCPADNLFLYFVPTDLFQFFRNPETFTLLLHSDWLPFLFHSGVRLQVNEFWVGASIQWAGCGQLLINDHCLTDIKYPGLTLSDRPESFASPKLRSIWLCHIWWINIADKQGGGNWCLNSGKVITTWLFSSEYFSGLYEGLVFFCFMREWNAKIQLFSVTQKKYPVTIYYAHQEYILVAVWWAFYIRTIFHCGLSCSVARCQVLPHRRPKKSTK